MIPRILRIAAFAAVPFVSLTAAASAPQIGAWFSASGVPDGMPVRDCPTHQPIYAYAFESDTSGADLSIGSLQSACNVYAGMSGSTAWAGDGALHFCGGLRHHRVKLFNQNADGSLTTLCAGSDPKSGFLCSSDWNSDLSTSPQPTNTTRCTVPGAQAPRTQFSTDGGRHFGACDNRDLVAFSLGQGN